MKMTDTMPQILESPPIPASPADIQVTKASPTAAELEGYLAAWLTQAEQKKAIDDLSLIGRTLAKPGEPYKYSKRTPPNRFRIDAVCLHYSPHSYISGVATTVHGNFERIVVTVGGEAPFELINGKQVVSIFRGRAFDQFGKTSQWMPAELKERMVGNFYLPGSWEETLLVYRKQAIHKLNEFQAKNDQFKRRDLLTKIGLA